jgi:fibronectin type 3 domain-containing protein
VTVKGAAIAGVNFTAIRAPVPVSHSVTLNWTASTSSNIVGYNVYRGGIPGGPYAQMGFVSGTFYVDTNVFPGQTYVYVVTAVDASGNESSYSTEVTVMIPMR